MAIVEKKTTEQRISLLNKAGLQYDEALKSYVLKDNSVLMSDIEEMDETEWNDSFNALMDDLRKGASESTDLIVKRELAGMADSDIVDLMKIIKDKDVMELAIHKKQIQKFKRKFLGNDKLVFTTVDDKATYDQVLVAWQTVKNYRTKQIEPDKKKRTSVLTAAIQFYNQKFNPLAEDAKKIEAPLGAILDDWDQKIKDNKAAVKKKEAEQEALRTKQIEATGAVLDMGTGFYFLSAPEFEIPEVSIGATDINKISDELFEKFIKQFTETNALIIAAKEKKRVEDEAETERLRLKKEQEDNEREEEKKELQASRIELRGELSEAAGMTFNHDRDGYEYQNLFVSTDNIKEFDKGQWDAFFSTIKTQIKVIKDAAKEKEEKEKRLATRPKDLLAIGMVGIPSKQHFSYHEVIISDHFLQTADNSSWEECIEDTKAKIETIKARIAQEEKRHNEVLELGYSHANGFYWYKGIKFDISSFINQDADEWAKTIEYLKKQPAGIDAAIKLQNDRYALLAPYATFGEQVEMKKLFELSAERFDELLTSKKAAYDKKIADDLELAETNRTKLAAENLAKSSDAVKLQHVIDNLPAIPEMQSEEFKKIAELISKKYDEIRALKK